MRRPYWLLLVAAGALLLVVAMLVSSPRFWILESKLRSSLRHWRAQMRPDPAVYQSLAHDSLQAGELEQALAEIEEAARVDPDDRCEVVVRLRGIRLEPKGLPERGSASAREDAEAPQIGGTPDRT